MRSLLSRSRALLDQLKLNWLRSPVEPSGLSANLGVPGRLARRRRTYRAAATARAHPQRPGGAGRSRQYRAPIPAQSAQVQRHRIGPGSSRALPPEQADPTGRYSWADSGIRHRALRKPGGSCNAVPVPRPRHGACVTAGALLFSVTSARARPRCLDPAATAPARCSARSPAAMTRTDPP